MRKKAAGAFSKKGKAAAISHWDLVISFHRPQIKR